MNLFGRPKAKKKAAPKISDSIQKLRVAQETLDKREAHLLKQIEQCTKTAKAKARKKDKKGALFYLKRKKMYERQVDQIYGKKTNIDIQIMALEEAASNKEMANAMIEGRNALQAHVNEGQIEQAQDVMDDLNDSIALSEEFSEALSAQIGPVMDEDELDEELKELEDEMADEDILALDGPAVPVTSLDSKVQEITATPTAVAAPAAAASAPRARAETAEEKEAREYAELEAMMAL